MKNFRRKLPRETSQLAILLALVAFFGILEPRFLSLESFQVMARAMAAPGFVAIGIALCAMNGVNGEVTLQEDVELSDGSCILETDQCEVDARIEKGLQAIGEALKGL